nr:MAG TPA: hypothetical protein [Caudoviricetes sp.]
MVVKLVVQYINQGVKVLYRIQCILRTFVSENSV